MNEQRQDFITEDASAPRWVGIVVVALAGVSLVALGPGRTASSGSKDLEQNLATQSEQFKKNEEVLDQRLAKAEDTNAQLQGELSVVTDKMKLTEGELGKARLQAKKIKEEDAKELSDLQNQTSAQLATKAAGADGSTRGPDLY